MVKPKLPAFSYDGPDEVVEIDELQWVKLADLLGTSLPIQDREQILFLCNDYLHWRRPEQDGASYQEAIKKISKLKSICRELQLLAWGEFEGTSVAANWLKGKVFAEMKKSQIMYSDYDIRHTDLGEVETINIPPVYFRLTEDVFMHIGIVLTNSINAVEKEISVGSSAAAFRNGDAFKRFLKNLRSFAKEKGIPHSGWTRTNEIPSKLSEFAFELNKLIPKNRRTNVSSQKRMAERIDLAESPA